MNPVPPPMPSKNSSAATTAPTRKRIVKLLLENIIGLRAGLECETKFSDKGQEYMKPDTATAARRPNNQ